MSPNLETPASGSNHWPFLAGLLLITLTCFWPVGGLGYIGYDDLDYVYQNAHVQSGLNLDNLTWAFTSTTAGNWHPLTWLSLMLDCELFGLNPQEEHWVNVGFHTANTLLIFLFLRQLTGTRWRSFFVAALFACHPLHVQSVAWIAERKDVLSGFFGILALMAYVRYCRSKTTADYVWMLVLFIMGLMAKPMLVTLPLVMLLLDFWPLGRIRIQLETVSAGMEVQPEPKAGIIQWLRGFPQGRGKRHPGRVRSPGHPGSNSDTVSSCTRRIPLLHSSFSLLHSHRALLIEKIPLFVLCLASSLVTFWAQNSGGAVVSAQVIPWSDRCLHAVIAYASYLGKLFWPANLAIFYPLPRTPPVFACLGSLLLLAGITLIAFRRRRSQPYLLVGWLWFLVMLVPVIGLVQVGLQSMADRYMYLPSIGLFIMTAWGMAEMAGMAPAVAQASSLSIPVPWRWFKMRREVLTGWKPVLLWQWAMAGAGTILVAACIADTRYQLGFWQNNLTLFQHVVDVSPENNYLGYCYLGISYAETGNLPASERCLKLSLAAKPKFALAKQRLGNVLLVEKKYGEAEPWLREIIRLEPQAGLPHVTLGLALAGEQKYAQAQAEYEAARRLMPGNATVESLIAANAPKADVAQTLAGLMDQSKTNATPRLHVQIGVLDEQQGEYPAAVSQYENALGMDTNSVEALNDLAWLLATCPEASVRNGPRAVALAEHACELTKFQTTIIVGTLAAAQAEAGRFDDAIATTQKACANATAKHETNSLKANEQLLGLYQTHQAYHRPDE